MVTGISTQIYGSCLSYSHVNKMLPKEVVGGIGHCECIGLLPMEVWANTQAAPRVLLCHHVSCNLGRGWGEGEKWRKET